MAGVLLVLTWRSSTGVEVRRPTRPVESTKIELVGAPPVIVNGTVAAVMSSIENLLAPPLAESLAVSCQSWEGKPVPVLVSSNLMRVLFSFSRMVSKPKDRIVEREASHGLAESAQASTGQLSIDQSKRREPTASIQRSSTTYERKGRIL